MSWSEIEMLQLETPAFHNTRGGSLKPCIVKNWHQVGPAHLSALLSHTGDTQLLGWVRSHPNDWVKSHPHDISTHIWLLRLCYTATAFNSIWWISHRSKISPPLSVHLASDGCWRHPQDLSLPECASLVYESLGAMPYLTRWNSADYCAVEHGTQIPSLFIDISLRASKRVVSKDRFTLIRINR